MKIKKYTVNPSTAVKAGKKVTRRVVRASQRIKADEDIQDEDIDLSVDVEPEASDLLFETDDVAQLVAEVAQQPVDVEVSDDGDFVDFTVGEDTFTVEPDDDTEVLECTHVCKGSTPVKSSRKVARKVTRRR